MHALPVARMRCARSNALDRAREPARRGSRGVHFLLLKAATGWLIVALGKGYVCRLLPRAVRAAVHEHRLSIDQDDRRDQAAATTKEEPMDPEVVLPAVVAIGVGFVVLPMMGMQAAAARSPLPVICPDNGKEEHVRVGMKRALLSIFTDGPQEVVGCSRWPGKQDCDHACEKHLRL
ncbi:MAG: hypothetical protein U0359_18490 [Byssovorax sp.]